MVDLSDSISGYFDAMDQAFTALDAVAASEAEQVKRNDLIYHTLNGHLQRLQHSFTAWKDQCRFAENFKIDTQESGFPLFQHVLELAEATDRRSERLLDMLSPAEIREQMIDMLLKFKQFPLLLQRQMAERVFLDTLGEGDVFRQFTAPQTLRHSRNPRSKRSYYVMHWAAYDGTAHLPLIYFAVIEDSSENAPKPRNKSGTSRRKDAFGQSRFDGLPNLELRERFREFAANHSSYSLNLTSIASALDRDFPELHPKQLRRFVLGPFYAGGLTSHNEKVQSVLDEVIDPADAWLLTWTMQELHSKEEVPAKHGLWGGSPAKEVFFINTSDVDCAAQGVSAIERYALIPHTAYQATYAQGLAGEIFKGYQCYIASGEHILRHV